MIQMFRTTCSCFALVVMTPVIVALHSPQGTESELAVIDARKVGEVCARHDTEHAELYEGPATFTKLLSQKDVCNDSIMARHLTARNITFDPSRINGDCNKLCGCERERPGKTLYCPCAKYKIVYLMTVAGYFLNRHGLSWFFYKGTAIGAVRHGGFMPYDQDHDADWGVILETEQDVEHFTAALREIDDFIRAKDYPHRGFVSFHYSKTDFREMGERNEAWIMSNAEDVEAARKPVDSRLGSHKLSLLQSQRAVESARSDRSHICFESKNCDIPLFMNAKLDIVGCVPIRNSTHDIVQCGSGYPTQYERADVLPLIECQFHGEAWPCPNQPQKIIEKYYHDPFLRQYYPGDYKPNGTSLECLQNNGWPSLLVCPDPDPDLVKRKGQKCGRLAPEVSRAYNSGSMPTREMQKIAGL